MVPAKVLLAPIPATPTKALTPSHVKGLLWLDVLFKATRLLADVTYRLNRVTYDVTQQTIGFWHYLDTTAPADGGAAPFASASDVDIGRKYVEYHRGPKALPLAALEHYRRLVESELWVHEASRRLLDLWEAQFRELHLYDPGLKRGLRPTYSVDDVLDALRGADALLDLRSVGGPAFLDLTDEGHPLRQLVGADGSFNYVTCTLRELAPLARAYDLVVFVCDEDLRADYVLIRRALERLGARTALLALSRVPLQGEARSARHGGWDDCALSALLERYRSAVDPDALRLGLRLYFIMHHGRKGAESFSFERAEHFIKRAERFLARSGRAEVAGRPGGGEPSGEPGVELRELLRGLSAKGYVDPYRLTCSLLQLPPSPLADELLARVYA